MKNLLLLLFLFCFSAAFGQTHALKFDNQHTIYKVPEGKEWHLNFDTLNESRLGQIVIDNNFKLSLLNEMYKKSSGYTKKIILQKSLQSILQPGESFTLTVTEYDAQPKSNSLNNQDGFRGDCCPLLEGEKAWP